MTDSQSEIVYVTYPKGQKGGINPQVGIICIYPPEARAMVALFDKITDIKTITNNNYYYGAIHGYQVVVCEPVENSTAGISVSDTMKQFKEDHLNIKLFISSGYSFGAEEKVLAGHIFIGWGFRFNGKEEKRSLAQSYSKLMTDFASAITSKEQRELISHMSKFPTKERVDYGIHFSTMMSSTLEDHKKVITHYLATRNRIPCYDTTSYFLDPQCLVVRGIAGTDPTIVTLEQQKMASERSACFVKMMLNMKVVDDFIQGPII